MDLEEPTLPKIRKKPRRIDEGSAAHEFEKPEAYYRKKFYELLDCVINSLNERYNKCTAFSKLKNIEEFTLNSLNSLSNLTSEELKTVLGKSLVSDFNIDRLKLHIMMLSDVCKAKKIQFESFSELKHFFQSDNSFASTFSEITKLIQIFYVVPVTTCTAERSFSMLRRLKNYLRSSMSQQRLNHVAILNTYKEKVDELDIKGLINAFILRSPQRRNTFANF